jgi:hypothetical protein
MPCQDHTSSPPRPAARSGTNAGPQRPSRLHGMAWSGPPDCGVIDGTRHLDMHRGRSAQMLPLLEGLRSWPAIPRLLERPGQRRRRPTPPVVHGASQRDHFDRLLRPQAITPPVSRLHAVEAGRSGLGGDWLEGAGRGALHLLQLSIELGKVNSEPAYLPGPGKNAGLTARPSQEPRVLKARVNGLTRDYLAA